ncbi:hypothetical protein BGW38_009153 [Lunasporangiospora selenospora]|uniref:Uncharacterized protein n=1 Tax=Lunasporangiospora selenospora TaxID=979761 RepID=A0A9P6G3G3_9FUNG|nr:hypothetical protein BGW38_009153 [Lunasporangiospora selenospora]
MTTVPSLPFVVLNAHKPSSIQDLISGTDPSESTDVPPASSSRTALGAGEATSPSSRQSPSTTARPGSTSSTAMTTAAAVPTTAGPVPSSGLPANLIQTRTTHPQVHYLFENDPLEAEIMDSIPRSRCITLDLDPKTGAIKNVESFLPNLQVMDIRLESHMGSTPTQQFSSPSSMSSPPSSSSTPTVSTGGSTGAVGSAGTTSTSMRPKLPSRSGSSSSATDVPWATNTTGARPSSSSSSVALSRSNSLRNQTIVGSLSGDNSFGVRPGSTGSSSITSSTAMPATKLSRRPSERSGASNVGAAADRQEGLHQSIGPRGDGGGKTAPEERAPTVGAGFSKDWTLVIDAVEVENDSESSDIDLLEQSNLSILDNEPIADDYIAQTEALLKSFSARNTLVRRVLDFPLSSPSNPATNSPVGL